MELWHVLIFGLACAGGVVIFLKLVADGMGAASAALAQLEEQERKAYEKREGHDAGAVGVGVVAA
jgi:hypothetical protein